MQGIEFYNYLDKFPILKTNFFSGIRSINTLPCRLNYRHFIIVNFDESTARGSHWFLFYRSTKHQIECFDSLGLTDLKKDLIVKHCKFTQEIIFNETQFQKLDSDTCGLFVIYFCIERSFNADLDFETFLELCFVENCEENELIVKKFCSDILLDKF